MWMKVANPNSTRWLNYWRFGDSMAPKKMFLICFYILFVLLFCKLLRRELGELVFGMEHNPSVSMKILHEPCESRFYNEIGRKIYGEQKDEDGRSIFDAD
jgi:hypothetical protein